MGVETNTGQFKVGNGSTAWNSLAYGGIQGQTGPTGPQGVTGPTGPTGPNGGLDILTDVTIGATLPDNSLLAYDTATSQWINQTAAQAGVAALSGASFTGNISTTGTVSGAPAAGVAATAASNIGYMGIPASGAGASGTYTLVESDAGELVYTTSSRTVNIPANSSVPFQIGTTIVFISGSGATTTIGINSDTLVLAGQGTTGSRTLAAHGMATAVKVAATTWYISGNGLT
jgi:hypothetical protein